MEIEWSQEKNQINYAKHRVSFETASKIFDDPLTRYIFDRVAEGEERWHALGAVKEMLLLVVVHTYRDEGDKEIIRIISARPASSHERRSYEQD
jgi:uncharacterized DUF497 family protein